MRSSSTNELNEEVVQNCLISIMSPPSQGATRESDNSAQSSRGGGEKGSGGGGYVSERTMDIMLREMRKLDRDRDRVLHPVQVKTLFGKYKVILIYNLFCILEALAFYLLHHLIFGILDTNRKRYFGIPSSKIFL